MKICLHVGPYCTAADDLCAHLSQNTELLAEHQIALRIEDEDRAWLHEVLSQAGSSDTKGDKGPDPIGDLDLPVGTKAVVLCAEDLLGPLGRPYANLYWYGRAKPKIEAFYRAFAQHDLQCSIALSDPARAIPALYAENIKQGNHVDFKNFLGPTTVEKLLWSELIERVQLREQYRPVIAWTVEDYPYIWRQVIQAMTGLPNAQLLEGTITVNRPGPSVPQVEHYLKSIRALKSEGAAITDTHWTEFIASFHNLTKLPDHPKWKPALQRELSEIYDEDLYTVARMEAVTFLQRPRF
ncbi:MAG: hypothetical protein AAF826_03935 [Pseudomonadota bacterium]